MLPCGRAWISPDEIQITASGYQLTIYASHTEKSEKDVSKRRVALRREHDSEELMRVFALPAGFDAGKIEASHEHGLVTLRAPKAEATQTRRSTSPSVSMLRRPTAHTH